MKELMQKSFMSSSEPSNKESEVNRLLADVAARYIALHEVFEEYGVCETVIEKALRSSEEGSFIHMLRSNGFLQMAPSINTLISSGSFSAADAKNLFQDDSSDADKSIFQKFNFISKKPLPKKSKRFTLFKFCLKEIFKGCHKPKYYKESNINYSQADLQKLLNLVSDMIPKYIKEYQTMKAILSDEDKIKSFGESLNTIVRENNIAEGGESDYIVLLAMFKEFEKYDFVINQDFKDNVSEYRDRFVDLNSFLSQKRVLATLFAINVKIMHMDSGRKDASQALQVINDILGEEDSEVTYEDITSDISRQAHLFVKSFYKPNPKSSQDIVVSVLRSARTLTQQALSVCKYLIVGTDISLISLSLVAGPSVLIANGLLILSMSVVAILAFIADAGCFNIDKVSAKFYNSSLNVYNKILGKNDKAQELVIRSDITCFKPIVQSSGKLIMANQQRRSGLDPCQRSGIRMR